MQMPFADLLSIGVRVLWHRVVEFLVLAILFLLPWVILELTVVASLAESQMLGADDARSRQFIGGLASTIIQGMLAGLLAVAVTWVAAGDLAGNHVNVPDAVRHALRRAVPEIGATLLFGLVIVVLVFVGALAIAVAGAIAGALGALIATLGTAVALLYATVRLCLAPAAVALEDAGPIESLARSMWLTRGTVWRTFGLVLVVGVASGAVIFGAGLITDGSREHAASTLLSVAFAPILPVMLTVLYRELVALESGPTSEPRQGSDPSLRWRADPS